MLVNVSHVLFHVSTVSGIDPHALGNVSPAIGNEPHA